MVKELEADGGTAAVRSGGLRAIEKLLKKFSILMVSKSIERAEIHPEPPLCGDFRNSDSCNDHCKGRRANESETQNDGMCRLGFKRPFFVSERPGTGIKH